LFKQETEQILASIISSPGGKNKNSYWLKRRRSSFAEATEDKQEKI
jgi:hypothetical protein